MSPRTPPPLALLLVVFAACHLGTPKIVADSETGIDSGHEDSSPPDTEESGEDSPDDSGNPFDRDDDGDGWSENQGDCDDGDPLRHPELADPCDGVDNDCDGQRDEDSASQDPYEPNDTLAQWAWIGTLEDANSLSLTAWLHNDQDIDRFTFYADDPYWVTLGFTVTLANIPTGANYMLTVGRLESDGSLVETQEVFGSDSLAIAVTGSLTADDSGDFGVVVEALGGADCARTYLLTVVE
jgi:hypothetical protein